MKRVLKLLNSNKKFILGIILGILLTSTTVYAVTALATSISYDNTSSGISATNVQDALDELYTRANTWINPNNNFGTPQYYAFGIYKGWCSSTDTKCNSFADFPTTSTSAPSGKNVYATKYEDGGYGVCINRNGTPHCFRGRNWAYESQHVQKVFSGANDSCNVNSSYVRCNASDFSCYVNSNGLVRCYDDGTGAYCYVNGDGYVECVG
jgi:hypothetical protein